MSKLFYRQIGEGPPLFILHGLYGSSDNWISIARQLSDQFTIYLPDARNHGQSPHETTHSFDDMASDLAELMNDLQIYQANIAGHSMGGKTAINFTALFPERVKRLMVIDISPRTYQLANNDAQVENHRSILSALNHLDISNIETRQQAENWLAMRIPNASLRQFLLKNLHRLPDGKYEWRLNINVLQQSLNQIMAGFEDKIIDLNFYKNPVMFLKGEKSGYIDFTGEQLINQAFPAAKIEIVKNAGHWIHADNPDEVVRQFNNFFKSS
jgi:esterase